ncbi:MAG: hypothetical protein IKA37_03895, partial [Spirochaetales bacterium]|nr:hypothetical protein [Spirochaetales bacterium]
KRKIIGNEFVKVFDEESSKLSGISFLAQGTIYPDIIESDGVKAHHNVGGLPEDMEFELVEPVRLLAENSLKYLMKKLANWKEFLSWHKELFILILSKVTA